MERYDFRPRPTQTSTTETLLLEGFAQGQVAEDAGLTTPELVVGPQDSTTAAWIGGYPEGSQAGPVPVSTSGLGSGPTLANVAFPDSILLRECAPDLRAEAEPHWDMEIREEGLSYQTSPPQLMSPTGIRSVYSTCHRLSSGQQRPGHQCCWTQTRHHTTNANRETFIYIANLYRCV